MRYRIRIKNPRALRQFFDIEPYADPNEAEIDAGYIARTAFDDVRLTIVDDEGKVHGEPIIGKERFPW